ncbi:hypothetical protein NMY22_g11235 [Coprinellus aureogranulatus]|nr:hypothetical protein NMY22_g11235 [Coprinellus aureogranulatus]
MRASQAVGLDADGKGDGHWLTSINTVIIASLRLAGLPFLRSASRASFVFFGSAGLSEPGEKEERPGVTRRHEEDREAGKDAHFLRAACQPGRSYPYPPLSPVQSYRPSIHLPCVAVRESNRRNEGVKEEEQEEKEKEEHVEERSNALVDARLPGHRRFLPRLPSSCNRRRRKTPPPTEQRAESGSGYTDNWCIQYVHHRLPRNRSLSSPPTDDDDRKRPPIDIDLFINDLSVLPVFNPRSPRYVHDAHRSRPRSPRSTSRSLDS